MKSGRHWSDAVATRPFGDPIATPDITCRSYISISRRAKRVYISHSSASPRPTIGEA